MIKKNILGLLFLLSALCLFNSCEDDPYYDDYGWATDALCNNTWVDFYTNKYHKLEKEFEKTPESQWLMENAQEYGFIMR